MGNNRKTEISDKQHGRAVKKTLDAIGDAGQGISEMRVIAPVEAMDLAIQFGISRPWLCLLCGCEFTDQTPPRRFVVVTAHTDDPNHLIINGLCLGCLIASPDLEGEIVEEYRKVFPDLRVLHVSNTIGNA